MTMREKIVLQLIAPRHGGAMPLGAHPTGEAVQPCALAFLGEGAIVATYSIGEVVAWRLTIG